ncbi:uncharacterized protein GGS22DRAFT_184299 [Annulohypoxylon maeteangense]|uniref:uncharacterized protein n=1 Tax=Annulohypoxylon maeteangense TaxID=1927788 RepID=UPI0020088285|nr:uncharacterized protein GGS22DRAFT_184299 [Annulohypoxylon maeteangense]KAI0888720.1 hypothetical protein GGS22DRAFT_184299 [Annulohypoxylon maeteangense]
MSIAAGVGHFSQSIVELAHGIFAAVVGFFQSIIGVIVGIFQSFIQFLEGILAFLINNVFILATGAALMFAYVLYSQRQGTTPVSRTIKRKSY